jgi:tetratricopeptide (TPR) repeat protein
MTAILKRFGTVALLFILSRGVGRCAKSTFEEARELQAQGDYPAAERSYRAFLSQQPRSVPALANLGVVLSRQGKFSEAINVYRTALSINADALAIKVDLALAYYRAGNWKNSIAAFRAVLDADPNDRRSLQLLAVSYTQAAQFSQAAAAYEKLLPTSDPAILIGLASSYRELGRLHESDELLRGLLSKNADTPEVHFLLGLAQYARGDFEQAKSSFEESIRLAPDKGDSHFYLGAAYFKERNFREAIENWQTAVRLDPQYFSATFALGSLLSELGRYGEAQPYLEAALRMRPNDALTQLEMGRWCLLNSKLIRAAGLLEGAMRVNPKAKQASFLLAETYRKLGWKEKAAAEFARSRELYSNSTAEDSLDRTTKISPQNAQDFR